MNLPDNVQPTRNSKMSGEALVGLGITIGALGFLFLLLGWAQMMRESKESSMILLIIGGVMLAIGAITALTGSKRRSS